MPVLLQFSFTTPVLDAAYRRASDATLRLDGHYVLESGGIGWRVEVESADFDAFERGLAADETVASYDVLGTEGSSRLYTVELSDVGRRASILPLLGESGGEFVGGKRTDGEWTIRLRFSDDAALQAFADAVNDREDMSIAVESIRRETCDGESEFGLTPSQQEALDVALEWGYFDVPRRTTLAEIADEMGVSDQAVSERLRRAQKRVFGRVMTAEDE